MRIQIGSDPDYKRGYQSAGISRKVLHHPTSRVMLPSHASHARHASTSTDHKKITHQSLSHRCSFATSRGTAHTRDYCANPIRAPADSRRCPLQARPRRSQSGSESQVPSKLPSGLPRHRRSIDLRRTIPRFGLRVCSAQKSQGRVPGLTLPIEPFGPFKLDLRLLQHLSSKCFHAGGRMQ
jgi:hypothetical protein